MDIFLLIAKCKGVIHEVEKIHQEYLDGTPEEQKSFRNMLYKQTGRYGKKLIELFEEIRMYNERKNQDTNNEPGH